MVPTPVNHVLCVACGAPHDQWPALDDGDGDLCDACFADAADDDWFTTTPGHPHGIDQPDRAGH